MGSDCSNLSLLSNPCEIKNCAVGLKMLPKSTASPSAQCIITLQPGTHFNGKPVAEVFVKFFVNPFNITTGFFRKNYTEYVMSQLKYGVPQMNYSVSQVNKSIENLEIYLGALYYEMVLQGSVISPIVNQNICPFFPVSYLVGYNCVYTDLLSLIKTSEDQSQLPAFIIKSLLQYLPKPSVTKGANVTGFVGGLKYCMSVSEVLTGKNLYTWMNDNVFEGTDHWIDFWVIMFQIAIACYVMELAGVSHNDLHAGNVIVVEHPQPVNYCFSLPQLFSSFIRFESKYEVKVFDFDRSSFSQYINPVMSKTKVYLEYHSYTTKPVKTKDFFTLFINIAYVTFVEKKSMALIESFLGVLAPNDPKLMSTINEMFKTSSYLQQKNKRSLNYKFFKSLYSTARILTNLMKKGSIFQTAVPPSADETVYVIDSNFFNNSRVVTTKVYQTLQKMQVEQMAAEYSEENMKHETLQLNQDVAEETARVHQLQLELSVQLYDLGQLKPPTNPIFLQLVESLQQSLVERK
jgi:hypothetical protein